MLFHNTIHPNKMGKQRKTLEEQRKLNRKYSKTYMAKKMVEIKRLKCDIQNLEHENAALTLRFWSLKKDNTGLQAKIKKCEITLALASAKQ